MLLGERAGDNAQPIRLVDALGFPVEHYRLSYNPLYLCGNWLLGASLASLRSSQPALEPPWPDLVVGIGRRSVPIARWIRAQSGGRTRLVHMGRPRAPLDWFDHIVTTPQYGLPSQANITHLPLPLTHVTPERLRAARQAWRQQLQALPRPRIVVFVGGPSWSVKLGVREARATLRAARQMIADGKGTLLITTAPRTPPPVADFLERAITPPHWLYRWDRHLGEDNPYLGFLAWAETAVVTQDSVAALADAVAARLPTRVIALPERWPARVSAFQHGPIGRRLLGRLEQLGLLTSAPNLKALQAELERLGLARPRADGFELLADLSHKWRESVDRTLDTVRGLALAGRAETTSSSRAEDASSQAY